MTHHNYSMQSKHFSFSQLQHGHYESRHASQNVFASQQWGSQQFSSQFGAALGYNKNKQFESFSTKQYGSFSSKQFGSSIFSSMQLGMSGSEQLGRISTSRFNLSEVESDITVFVRQFKERVYNQLDLEAKGFAFVLFDELKNYVRDESWLKDNTERFLKDTPNESLVKESYLSELGYIMCMKYSPDGNYIIVGHSTGLIQVVLAAKVIDEFRKKINSYYDGGGRTARFWYPMFSKKMYCDADTSWVADNEKMFLKNTPNRVLFNRWMMSENGFITALVHSPDGRHIIAGHSTGLIQMRHGQSGTVVATLRNIQFPPKPVFSIQFSRSDNNVCYAACTDGAVYKIDIPEVAYINIDEKDTPQYCIRADPTLECLNTQYYGTPGPSGNATPFITQRFPALCLDLTSDATKMVVGSSDTSIKVYDLATQEVDVNYKVHKLRLQFIPKKLQRIHCAQVVAVQCHDQKPYVFASGAWDNTLRIWDTRCKVGCMMTFEGVNICHNSIDLNREQCISGSWSPTEALAVWDLTARKKLHVVRAQNRRPDVDGEYFYACRYWKSSDCNRKGKYAIVGGSGTNCVEVINLHNRYISCSYPAAGTVLAVSSYENRIAFGGTAPVFNIVSFYDPKHEKYADVDFDPSMTELAIQDFKIDLTRRSSIMAELEAKRKAHEKELRGELSIESKEEQTEDGTNVTTEGADE